MPDNTVSLSELFARDPRAHSEEDIRAIVSALRDARSKYIVGNKKTSAKKEPTGEKAKVAKLDLDIKL